MQSNITRRSTVGTRLVAASSVIVGLLALSVLAGFAFAHRATNATKVKVVLAPPGHEYGLKPATPSTKAGKTTFVVSNNDTGQEHELVVLKTNLAPNKLPVKNRSIIGGSLAIEVGRVGKPLLVYPGNTKTLTLTLKPGKYVLICNLLGHYLAGQHAAFRVGS